MIMYIFSWSYMLSDDNNEAYVYRTGVVGLIYETIIDIRQIFLYEKETK